MNTEQVKTIIMLTILVYIWLQNLVQIERSSRKRLSSATTLIFPSKNIPGYLIYILNFVFLLLLFMFKNTEAQD